MLKKTITYEDFNGETVSEDFFFHLSKAELVELELSQKGGLSEALQRIIAAEDGKGIVAEFKNIILKAYGKRSDDGRRFIKNQALREEFESTEAYSELFIELVTNTDSAVEFINGVVPAGMAETAADIVKVENRAALEVVPETEQPYDRHMTDEEFAKAKEIIKLEDLAQMSDDDLRVFRARLATGDTKLGA